MKQRAVSLLVGVCTVAATAAATAAANAQAIPMRRIEPAAAQSVEPLGLILGLKQLSAGRVLVDDAQHRRLLMFDSTLTRFTVVADTTGSVGFKYGDWPGAFVPYLGDSTLVFEWRSQTLLVLDGLGKIARVTAPPKPREVASLNSALIKADPQGRLVYRGVRPTLSPPVTSGQQEVVRQNVDSAPLVRADFDTRRTDTLAQLKMPVAPAMIGSLQPDGSYAYNVNRITPLSWVDEWTVTADGAIAIVRGQDYHIDWINPDGTRASTPKMPFDWLRLTDADKQRLSDSARVAEENRLTAARLRSPVPVADRPGVRRVTASLSTTDGAVTVLSRTGRIDVVPPSRIPDYWPPFRFGGVTADRDGNVWILPATTAQRNGGGIVYDVVNRRGELFERVQLPVDRSVAGFGPGGVVYMAWRDSSSVWHLEKSRVHR